jgi:hypothetical protein
VAGLAVFMAPSASAAPQETVAIQTLTPPVKSVDRGGKITFVNQVPAYSTGVSLPLVGSVSATVNTDVSVTFFGQKRDLQFGQSATWTFPDPATAGSITYGYRIVPQAGLAANVANQVVSTVAGTLPPAPVNLPYVVETLAPLPTLPGANLPQLPQVTVPLPNPGGTVPPPNDPDVPPTDGGVTPPPAGEQTIDGAPGDQYTYNTGGGAPQLSPADMAAASAFDPSRYEVPGRRLGGSGGVAGSYDGASVPVFGQLDGLDAPSLDDQSTQEVAAASSTATQTLPAAALAAVVALAAVTAALVRTHQASRGSR